MSGGGSSGGPGGGFEASSSTPCDELVFQTSIASPQPVATELSVGDILQVTLDPGPPKSVVQLVDDSGRVVGSIITHIPDLLRCIQDGHGYEAEVQSVEGGDFQVKVRPA